DTPVRTTDPPARPPRRSNADLLPYYGRVYRIAHVLSTATTDGSIILRAVAEACIGCLLPRPPSQTVAVRGTTSPPSPRSCSPGPASPERLPACAAPWPHPPDRHPPAA